MYTLSVKAPARYIGQYPVVLRAEDGRPRDATGAERATLALHTGDTLLIPMGELYGYTLKLDPLGAQPQQFVSLGAGVLPEDAKLPLDALIARGYAFNAPRADFEPLLSLDEAMTRLNLPPASWTPLPLFTPVATHAGDAAAQATTSDATTSAPGVPQAEPSSLTLPAPVESQPAPATPPLDASQPVAPVAPSEPAETPAETPGEPDAEALTLALGDPALEETPPAQG